MKEFFNSVGDWFLNNWQPIVKTLAIIIFGFIIVKIVLAVIKRQLAKTKLDKSVQRRIKNYLERKCINDCEYGGNYGDGETIAQFIRDNYTQHYNNYNHNKKQLPFIA